MAIGLRSKKIFAFYLSTRTKLIYILTAKTQGRKELKINNLSLSAHCVFAVIHFT